MARKNVGQLVVGQLVTVDGQEGVYRIAGFPSRRLAVAVMDHPREGQPSMVKVELRALRPVEHP